MPVVPRAELVALLVAATNDVLDTIGGEAHAPLDETSRLFGEGGLLDSMGLVTLVIDVEQRLHKRYALALHLADERAMSRRSSPFRRIDTLADYILTLISEHHG